MQLELAANGHIHMLKPWSFPIKNTPSTQVSLVSPYWTVLISHLNPWILLPNLACLALPLGCGVQPWHIDKFRAEDTVWRGLHTAYALWPSVCGIDLLAMVVTAESHGPQPKGSQEGANQAANCHKKWMVSWSCQLENDKIIVQKPVQTANSGFEILSINIYIYIICINIYIYIYI